MDRKFYIPKTNEIITIEYNYDEKEDTISYRIYDSKHNLLKSHSAKDQIGYNILKSYITLIELFYDKTDDYDLEAIEYNEEVFNTLTNPYEQLDKSIITEEMDSFIGTTKRIILSDNKIIRITSETERDYSYELNRFCFIELSPKFEVLKELKG